MTNECKNFQVSDTDLEVIETTTGRSPSEDSGLGMTVPDIRNRYFSLIFPKEKKKLISLI